MNRTVKESVSELELARNLRALKVDRAPASILIDVLRRVGLGDSYWTIESPIGPVFVAHSKAGVSMVSRASSARAFEHAFRARHGRPISPEKAAPPSDVRGLVATLKGRGLKNLRLDLRGLSEFERAVLLKALEIPHGEVRPYGWIAREIGHPDAVRAAGSALAKNPIPLLIPCHRVVRSDGRLGEYSLGGPRNKRALLEAEGAEPETLQKLASSGVRYLGNEAGRYYCFPTCGGIQSLVRENRIRFASAREAVTAGYRPCEACRPAAA